MIKKLLIANRGEIAVRIIRAAKDLGIKSLQVYSDADVNSLPVKIADEGVNIGASLSKDSYLNMDAIISAALKHKADAIHPGYGFLAENAKFAEKVKSANLIFVGPTAETIRSMGDKSTARKVAHEAGILTVPGSEVLKSLDEAVAEVKKIGFPVMIKASAGGGGKGIRVANNQEEFEAFFSQASQEAQSTFGDGSLYIEKVIRKARHIEVQILGDGKKAIHCYERECSLQRRRQKVWEECPSSILDDKVRQKLCESAVKLSESIGYVGAGTIEFLYDESCGDFYFIEMNTRIQVEHPVTEEVTGVDLVAEMLRIAGGEPLGIKQDAVGFNGHAIEVRINAEDPLNNFMPFPGVVGELHIPGGMGVRFDHMIYSNYQIPPFYDSLLGKLIVWGRTREEAIRRLNRSVSELKINGVKTTQPLFMALLKDKDVLAGKVHTTWLENWLEKKFKK